MKLPKTIMGLGGPIRVKVVERLKVKGDRVHGSWDPRKRLISLDAENTAVETEQTFYHELMHAALDDSGQWNLLTKEGAEALCDLVAMARMREKAK